jgi:non-heme chloroperoxidase
MVRRPRRAIFATHLGNDVSPALIANELRRCLSASPMATAEVWRSSFHADHRAGRQAITVLVLIIHGAADQSATIDLTGQRTASLVPGCRYKEYPTVGHGLYVTHAKRLNTDLLDFIKS